MVCDRRLTKAQREYEDLATEGLASAPYDQARPAQWAQCDRFILS